VTEVFKEASEAIVTSEAVTVSREVATVADISYYLYNRKSVTSVTNQVAS
jgi:hypothetical protein